MNELRPIPDDIIARLLPEELPSVEQIEAQYPPRQLPEGARVTRFAPSPTGFLHIGSLYSCLMDERVATKAEGFFICESKTPTPHAKSREPPNSWPN
jgi:hypothetical protein